MSCSSETRPLSWPDCAILRRISSICLALSGLTSAILDTVEVIYLDFIRTQKEKHTTFTSSCLKDCRHGVSAHLLLLNTLVVFLIVLYLRASLERLQGFHDMMLRKW